MPKWAIHRLKLSFLGCFCSPAKSLTLSGLMGNPLVGHKVKVLTSKRNAPNMYSLGPKKVPIASMRRDQTDHQVPQVQHQGEVVTRRVEPCEDKVPQAARVSSRRLHGLNQETWMVYVLPKQSIRVRKRHNREIHVVRGPSPIKLSKQQQTCVYGWYALVLCYLLLSEAAKVIDSLIEREHEGKWRRRTLESAKSFSKDCNHVMKSLL